MEVTRFDMLDEVMNDVKLRMLLWESVDTWAKTVDEWYHMDFHTLNVEEMNLFTAKNIKNINQLEKGLPKNLVVPKLKENVEIVKGKVSYSTTLTIYYKTKIEYVYGCPFHISRRKAKIFLRLLSCYILKL